MCVTIVDMVTRDSGVKGEHIQFIHNSTLLCMSAVVWKASMATRRSRVARAPNASAIFTAHCRRSAIGAMERAYVGQA
jgi:hypothetical protein